MRGARRLFLKRSSAIAAGGCLSTLVQQSVCAATNTQEIVSKAPDTVGGDESQLLALVKQATGGVLVLDRLFEVGRPIDLESPLAITAFGEGGIEMSKQFPVGEFLFRLKERGVELSIKGGRFRTHSRSGFIRTFPNGQQKVSLTGVRASGFQMPTAGFIYCYGAEAVAVRNCVIEDCENGILIFGNSRNIAIVDNEFRRWRVNAVRVSGFDGERSENIRIEGNRVLDSTGNQSGIYVTCVRGARHRNAVISRNVCVGRGLAFPSGNADLISTWGIDDLICEGNTSRLGGDLGIAIEEVYGGLVTGNVCELNNYGGITIERSQRVKVTGNTCNDNGLDKDNKVDRCANPLAGIKVMGPAEQIVISGNTCVDTSGGKYQDTAILVNEVKAPVREIVIEGNKSSGHRLGATHQVGRR